MLAADCRILYGSLHASITLSRDLLPGALIPFLIAAHDSRSIRMHLIVSLS
jgi:hypothetical protein